jgi:peptidyl-tRNA hydrolase
MTFEARNKIDEEDEDRRMYCVVARESLVKMNGNRGKLAAQAGHAYLHAYWDAYQNFTVDAVKYQVSGKATKVCLIVDTVDELYALRDKYTIICGTSLVTDAGKTCFNGVPTVTCLGIGPIRDSDIGDDLKGLKVLI